MRVQGGRLRAQEDEHGRHTSAGTGGCRRVCVEEWESVHVFIWPPGS
jgi:hypothetical protein